MTTFPSHLLSLTINKRVAGERRVTFTSAAIQAAYLAANVPSSLRTVAIRAEAMAYYTSDSDDAITTGEAMTTSAWENPLSLIAQRDQPISPPADLASRFEAFLGLLQERS